MTSTPFQVNAADALCAHHSYISLALNDMRLGISSYAVPEPTAACHPLL